MSLPSLPSSNILRRRACLVVLCLCISVVLNNGWTSPLPTKRSTTRSRPHHYWQQRTNSRNCCTLRARNNQDEEDDDEEDDDPPDVGSVANFQPPKMDASFGLNRGRSSPNQRKAMGTSNQSTAKVFMCTNCGSESVQWMGRCPTCREWNTLQEYSVKRAPAAKAPPSLLSSLSGSRPTFGGGGGSGGGTTTTLGAASSWLDGIVESTRPIPITQVDLQSPESQRLIIPEDDELNSVLGGGLMKGSLILLGGDPGVGKSTLALQIASQVASLSAPPVGIGMGSSPTTTTTDNNNININIGPVWYVSGEETLTQIATRAQRLSAISSQLYLLAETNLNVLAEQIIEMMQPQSSNTPYYPVDNDRATTTEQQQPLLPSMVIIDSIQTMVCEAGGSSSPGGVSQLRECMALLLRLAKSTHIPIWVIGHVTKTGDIAGPRMVEHMVDAVLYLERAGAPSYRWLRAHKNRFGSCQTVGLYEFTNGILLPCPEGMMDGSANLKQEDLEGCAMAMSVEGHHRAMVSEVQALVVTSSSFVGKKTVDGGFSFNRLNLLLGVLQKHCGVFIGKSRDVYVNVVGGSSKKADSSCLDLAVSMALTSSTASVPIRGDTAFCAQVGLLGELRPLPSMEPRMLQAQRMGFSRVIVAGKKLKHQNKYGMEYIECPTLKQALELGLTAGLPPKRQKRTPGKKKASSKQTSSPESLEELELEDIILDDEDDEDDFQ